MQLKTVIPHARGTPLSLAVTAPMNLTGYTVRGQFVSGDFREDFTVIVVSPGTLSRFDAAISGDVMAGAPLGIGRADFVFTKDAAETRGPEIFFKINDGVTE